MADLLELLEAGGDLVGVGGVEWLHGRGEDLSLHAVWLEHGLAGEGRREVGRLELVAGHRGAGGRREGRGHPLLEYGQYEKEVGGGEGNIGVWTVEKSSFLGLLKEGVPVLVQVTQTVRYNSRVV